MSCARVISSRYDCVTNAGAASRRKTSGCTCSITTLKAGPTSVDDGVRGKEWIVSHYVFTPRTLIGGDV